MELSYDILTQFAKITNDTPSEKKESTVYGKAVKMGEDIYVHLDGAPEGLYTPVNTTADIKDGDRVTVMIKNHEATITGNLTDRSASSNTVKEQGGQINDLNNTITQQGNTINQQNNDITQINNTIAQQGNDITQINNTIAQQGNTIDQQGNTITQINNTIDQQGNTITQINNTIEQQGNNLELLNSDIGIYNSSFQITDGVVTGIKGVETDWISTKELEADHARIEDLDVKKLDATWANIEFANIDIGKFREFYAASGMVEYLTAENETVTGELVGVTIRGDLIQGNTIVADKLVIRGEDGLYYKLNTEGVSSDRLETEYSLTGETIDPVEGTVIEDSQINVEATVYKISNSNVHYCIVDDKYYEVAMETFSITDNVVEPPDDCTIEKFGATVSDNDIYAVHDSEGTLLYYCVIIDSVYYETVPLTHYRITGYILEDLTAEAASAMSTVSVNCRVYYYDKTDGTTGYYCRANDLYYEVEVSKVESEQNIFNSLDGKNIIAKTITATQINVSDLVAFDATIGGFEINNDSINTVTKTSVGSTNRGFYVDNDGQFNVGDSNNFIKFYKHVECSTAYEKANVTAVTIVKENLTINALTPIFYDSTSSDDARSYYCSVDGILYNVDHVDGSYAIGEPADTTPSFLLSLGETLLVTAPVYSYTGDDGTKYHYCKLAESSGGMLYVCDYLVTCTETYKLDISAAELKFNLTDKLESLTERVKIGTYEDPDTKYQVYSYTKEDGTTGYYCVVESVYYAVEYDEEESNYKITTTVLAEIDGTAMDGIFTVPDELPAIELSEEDSDFKQVITNKAAIYTDGSDKRTEIGIDGVVTEDLTLRGDHIQGNWVWRTRSNGNYGLSWIGGNE